MDSIDSASRTVPRARLVGLLLSVAGATLGATVAYAITRRVGRRPARSMGSGPTSSREGDNRWGQEQQGQHGRHLGVAADERHQDQGQHRPTAAYGEAGGVLAAVSTPTIRNAGSAAKGTPVAARAVVG